MKALILKSYNTPFVLEEIGKPEPVAGQVLVKIVASGINPLDLKIKSGAAVHAQVSLPAILGIDMAGLVEAVGEGVTSFKVGDEVYGMVGGVAGLPGTLAEYISVDANLLARKPRNLSFREAAALPLITITAWEGLVDRANVSKGRTVLVHGGAGGVGHVAIQLARYKGARVFTTVRPDKNELVTSYGATPIDYTTTGLEEYVREYTQGEGFDIVLDTLGGAGLDHSFKAVKHYTGHVVSILGWGAHNLAPLSFRGATYSGVFTLYPLISGQHHAAHGAILTAATHIAEAGKLKPLMDQKRYTFDTIEEAYLAMQNRTACGKVVIDI
jgi:NADPH:quinone reductase-like Zn-dependent oxidoreductase